MEEIMIICKNCNKENNDTSKFCGYCGNIIENNKINSNKNIATSDNKCISIKNVIKNSWLKGVLHINISYMKFTSFKKENIYNYDEISEIIKFNNKIVIKLKNSIFKISFITHLKKEDFSYIYNILIQRHYNMNNFILNNKLEKIIFKPTIEKKGCNNESLLVIDEVNKLWKCPNSNSNKIYKFEDLFNFELLQTNSQTLMYKFTDHISLAQSLTQKFIIKITLNDFNNPALFINIFPEKQKSLLFMKNEQDIYTQAYNLAQEIESILELIKKDNNKPIKI